MVWYIDKKVKALIKKIDEYDNGLDLIDKTRNDEIKLSDVKNDQINFNSHLGEIKKGSKKSKEQRNTIYNIEMLYKARKEAIKFFDDYSSMMSQTKNKTTKGTGL